MQGPRDSRRSVGGDAPMIGLDQGTTKASLCEVGLRPGHKSRSRFGIWLSRDLVCAQGSAGPVKDRSTRWGDGRWVGVVSPDGPHPGSETRALGRRAAAFDREEAR